MAAKTEGRYRGEFLLSEAPGTLSREAVTVTVAAATKLAPGHVLAKLTATGKYVEYDNAGADGSETARAVLYAEVDNSAGGAPSDFLLVPVVARMAEVRKADLQWFAAVVGGDKTAAYVDLEVFFILARD